MESRMIRLIKRSIMSKDNKYEVWLMSEILWKCGYFGFVVLSEILLYVLFEWLMSRKQEIYEFYYGPTAA